MSDLASALAALGQDPASEPAAEAVREAARRQRSWTAYAEAFTARGDALRETGAVDAACEAWVEAAGVYEAHSADLDRAAKLYTRVLEFEPQHRRALFALGTVLHDQQRWDDLIGLYRSRIEQSSDESERTTLHQYVAELLAEKKDDPDGGFDALMEAARRAPWNLRVLARLEHLGQRTGRLEEVAIAVGDMLIHQQDRRRRAALSLRLGEMHLGPIDDPTRALAFLRAALADDGGNPAVLEEIEDFFRERSRFDELAAFLEDVVEDHRMGPYRARLEIELARIYTDELADPPRAFQALARALQTAPQERALVDEVLRVADQAKQPEAAVSILDGLLRRVENPLFASYIQLKLEPLRREEVSDPVETIATEDDRLGRLEARIDDLDGEARVQAILDAARSARVLGHSERSERMLRSGLREHRSHPGLLNALTELMESMQRWPEWLELCGRRLEILEPQDALQDRMRMIEVLRQEGGDLTLASGLAEEAIADVPTDPRPWLILAELIEDSGDGRPLMEVLQRWSGAAPAEVLKPLGGALHRMGEGIEAATLWEDAIKLTPQDEALRGALAGLWLDLEEPEAAERHLRLLSGGGSRDAQATAWLRLAEHWSGDGPGMPRGLEALERARALAPDRTDILAFASDQAAATGDVRRAGELAERCGDLEDARPSKSAWYRRAAQLADFEQRDADRAISLYTKALASDPDDPEVAERLGEIFVARGEWARAHPYLAAAAEALRDEGRAADVYEAAARAAEAARDEPAARYAYRRALERSPNHRAALLLGSALEDRLAGASAAYDLTASLLLHHGEALSVDQRVQAQLRLARGKWARSELVEATRMADSTRRLRPESVEALALHAELLEATTDPRAAVVLRDLAQRQPPGATRAQVLYRAAVCLARHDPEDTVRRIAWLEEAISNDPSALPAVQALADVYQAMGDASRASGVLEAALARTTSDVETATLATRAAELLRLESRERAAVLLDRALAVDPGYAPAVAARSVMLAYEGRPEARVEVLTAAANAAESPEQAEAWRRSAVRVMETQLSVPGRALALVERDPANTDLRDDLAYALAQESQLGLQDTIDVWVDRCLQRQPDPLAFFRVERLLVEAGASGSVRYLMGTSTRAVWGGAPPLGAGRGTPAGRASNP